MPLLDPKHREQPLERDSRYGRHHSFHQHPQHILFKLYGKRWVLLVIIVLLQMSSAMV